MSKIIPITNDGKTDLHVGSRLVPPGETKLFDEPDVPLHMRPHDKPAPLPTEPDDPLLELLDQPVKDIKAAIEERDPQTGKPVLSDDAIIRLAEAEANGKTRSTLVKALEEERFTRANEAQQSEDLAVFATSLPELDYAQLSELKEKHKEDPQRVQAIALEQIRREISQAVEQGQRDYLVELRDNLPDDVEVPAAVELIDEALAKLEPQE